MSGTIVYDDIDSKDGVKVALTVYIPSCDSSQCQNHLNDLAAKFSEKGIQCFHKHKLNGLYKHHFERCMGDTSFTVLHKCPRLWGKIRSFSSTLQEEGSAEKLMVVSLGTDIVKAAQTDCINQQPNDASTRLAYEQFFELFSISHVSNDESLEDFVSKVADHASSAASETSSTADAGDEGSYDRCQSGENGLPTQGAQYQVEMPQGAVFYDKNLYDSDNMFESLSPEALGQTQGLTRVLDMFGQISHGVEVYARADCLKTAQDTSPVQYTVRDLKEVNAWRNHPDQQTVKRKMQQMMHKILPELFRSKNASHLVHLAVCNLPELQERALTFLELLLLQGDLSGSDNKKQCEDAEQILAEAISSIRSRYATSATMLEKLYPVTSRMCNVMIMLHCEIAKDGQNEMEVYGRFNTTVRSHLNTKGTKSSILQVVNTKGTKSSIKQVDKLFQRMDNIVQKLADSMTEGAGILSVDKLKSASDSAQIIFIYEQLKKMFSDHHEMDSTLFKELISQPALSKKLPRLCKTLLFSGLALFLRHGLRSAGLRDIESICENIFDFFISDTGKDGCVPEEVILTLAPLLYDDTPVIHNKVRTLFTERGLYCDSKKASFQKEEIIRLLYPLLQKTETPPTQTNKWMAFPGTFCDKKVIVEFDQCDEETEPSMYDPKIRQLNALLKLQHDNIIKLFAFQKSHVPRFYITEGFMASSLQRALKYGNDNKKYIDITTLTRYLMIAAEALKYCHEAGIVHRNLTAASLFLSDETVLKLGGFHLAIDLDAKEYFKDPENPDIPVRWSAHESLNWGRFNFASDIWMLGAVMYEVLTHGALPYSHTDITYEDLPARLAPLQSSQQPLKLNREECFRDDHYEIMCQCVTVNPKHRPALSEIIAKLKDSYFKMKAVPTDTKPKYPDLKGGSPYSRCPSTVIETAKNYQYCRPGPPKLTMPDLVQKLSVNLSMYKRSDGYIFREEVSPTLPEEVSGKVISGEVGHILPAINIWDNQDQTIIDYYIKAQNVSPIMHIVERRTFGDRFGEYIELLAQVAQVMLHLHEQDLVLGYTDTLHLYLAQKGGERKMHIVSFAHMNTLQPDSRSKEAHNVEHIIDRVAPEVQRDRFFTTASDVYNLGQLMMEILTTLVDRNLLYSYLNTANPLEPLRQVREQLKEQTSETTGNSICDLVESCIQENVTRRPTMAQVVEIFQGMLHELKPSYVNVENENPYCSVQSYTVAETVPRQYEMSRDNPYEQPVPHQYDEVQSLATMRKYESVQPSQVTARTPPKNQNRPLPRIPNDNGEKNIEVNKSRPFSKPPPVKPKPASLSNVNATSASSKLVPVPTPPGQIVNSNTHDSTIQEMSEEEEGVKADTNIPHTRQNEMRQAPQMQNELEENVRDVSYDVLPDHHDSGINMNNLEQPVPVDISEPLETQNKILPDKSMSDTPSETPGYPQVSLRHPKPHQPYPVPQGMPCNRCSTCQHDNSGVDRVPARPGSVTQVKEVYRNSLRQTGQQGTNPPPATAYGHWGPYYPQPTYVQHQSNAVPNQNAGPYYETPHSPYAGWSNYTDMPPHDDRCSQAFPVHQQPPYHAPNNWVDPNGNYFQFMAQRPQCPIYVSYNPQYQPHHIFPMGHGHVQNQFMNNTPFNPRYGCPVNNAPHGTYAPPPAPPHPPPYSSSQDLQESRHGIQPKIPTSPPDCPQGKPSPPDGSNKPPQV